MTRKIFPAAAAPSTPHGAPPLWQQLGAVAQGLQMILAGQSGNQALAEVPARLRPGVQALLFQVLRQLGRAQALRAQLAPKAPPPKVNALLCTALALAWDAEQAPYEPFTLVNQAVEAAKRLGMERQAGFLNGCLRRFLRERDALVAATAQDIQACWNHPRWWIERLQRDHPQDWQQILQANNAHAPMSLRVNQQKTTPGAYVQLLAQQGMTASVFGDSGVQLQQAQPVQALPGFAEGHVSVQDGAAQLAADLLLRGLDCTQPLQLLDACAAPGGKTAHLLEHAGAQSAVQVVALEVDAERSLRIHDTLQRVGVAARAKVMVADAGQPQGSSSMPSCWMHRARLRALCAAIQTCAGCAVPQMWSNWRLSSRRCWMHCGRCSNPEGACCTAPVQFSRPKVMHRYKRFLHATSKRNWGLRRAI
jgi:16S rRNA (cytosine967-C5)-methyltransferase